MYENMCLCCAGKGGEGIEEGRGRGLFFVKTDAVRAQRNPASSTQHTSMDSLRASLQLKDEDDLLMFQERFLQERQTSSAAPAAKVMRVAPKVLHTPAIQGMLFSYHLYQ